MSRAWGPLLSACVTVGCLPADSRPTPGSVFVSAQPSEATRGGFTTADGWQVRFESFLTALGDVDLHDPDEDGDEPGPCNLYSETHYEKLFDFATAEGGKVGLVYGLGECSVEYRVRGPSESALLGAGADSEDAALMRARGSDAYAEDERVALLVRGVGLRDGVEKRFEWSFRRSFEVAKCSAESGDSPVSVVGLTGGAAIELRIVVKGDELFRVAPNDDAPIEFDRYAAADADDDGNISFIELDAVPAELSDEWPQEGLPADEPDLEPFSLGTVVYELLLPRVTRLLGSGVCEARGRP